MKKIFIYFMFISIFISLSLNVYSDNFSVNDYLKEVSLKLTFTYDRANNSFNFSNLSLETYSWIQKNYDGGDDFKVKIFSLNNVTLFKEDYDFQRLACAKPLPGNDIPSRCNSLEVENVLSLPYFPTLDRIEVWKGDDKLLVVNASAYNTCNLDSICDLDRESYLTCPSDCRAPEDKTDSGTSLSTIIIFVLVFGTLIAASIYGVKLMRE